MKEAESTRSEEGFSLATVMIIALVCTLWISALFASVLPSFNRTRESRIKTALRSASEAAMDWATASLSTGDPANIDQTTFGQWKTSPVPAGVYGDGGYPITAEVTVWNIEPNYNFQGTPSYNPDSPQSYLYDPLFDRNLNGNNGVNNWRVVTTTASVAGRRSTVRCVLKPAQPINGWPFGAVAAGRSFRMHGTKTTLNYYNSNNTPLPTAGDFKTDPDPDQNEANASIGLEGADGTENEMHFAGDGTIGGHLSYMPGTQGDPTPNTNGSNPDYDGNLFPDAPSAPSGSTPMTSISKATTLTPGDYHFSGNTTAISGGPIDISGATAQNPVRIFIDGTVSSAIALNGKNGIFNNNGVPGALQIFYNGTGTISIGGNGDFRGVIYAPKASVKLAGNGEYYGAVVGRDVRIDGGGGGATFHYDQALRDLDLNFAIPANKEVVSWQEL